MRRCAFADSCDMTESPTHLHRPKLADVVSIPSAHGTLLRIDLTCDGVPWTFSAADATWITRAGDPVTPDQLRMHFLKEVSILSVFEGAGRVELWSADGLTASFRGNDSRLTRDPLGDIGGAGRFG